MKKTAVFILVFSFIPSLIQAEKIYDKTMKNFTIDSVYDGDTFYINIKKTANTFGKKIGVRIRGIDTPELRDKNKNVKDKAIKARDELSKLLKSGNVVLHNVGRDKYFRILADVKVGKIDVAEYMIKEGYARPYNGGKKLKWD